MAQTHIAFGRGYFTPQEVEVMREAFRMACVELAITGDEPRQRRMLALFVREMIETGELRTDRIAKAAAARCRSFRSILDTSEARRR